jgi:hypothetical protein
MVEGRRRWVGRMKATDKYFELHDPCEVFRPPYVDPSGRHAARIIVLRRPILCAFLTV